MSSRRISAARVSSRRISAARLSVGSHRRQAHHDASIGRACNIGECHQVLSESVAGEGHQCCTSERRRACSAAAPCSSRCSRRGWARRHPPSATPPLGYGPLGLRPLSLLLLIAGSSASYITLVLRPLRLLLLITGSSTTPPFGYAPLGYFSLSPGGQLLRIISPRGCAGDRCASLSRASLWQARGA